MIQNIENHKSSLQGVRKNEKTVLLDINTCTFPPPAVSPGTHSWHQRWGPNPPAGESSVPAASGWCVGKRPLRTQSLSPRRRTAVSQPWGSGCASLGLVAPALCSAWLQNVVPGFPGDVLCLSPRASGTFILGSLTLSLLPPWC